MKKVLFAIIFLILVGCISFIAFKPTKYTEQDYKDVVNLIKICYSAVNNSNNTNDHWIWGKETQICSKCNQLLLRNIEFIHNYIGDDSVKEEKIIVETCKNENCKYFVVHQIPMHKNFPFEERDEVKPICLYEGKYKNLEEVWLEKN